MAVEARTNVTLDDGDSRIVYEGQWNRSSLSQSSLDYGGSHQFASAGGSRATFKFTGVAVYFISPLWPRSVSTLIQLDNEPSVLLNLTDPGTPLSSDPSAAGTVQAQAVWGEENLVNGDHTLVISVGEGESTAIVDALTYTALDSPQSSSSSSNKRTIAIAVGCVAASMAVGLLLGLFLFCRRRQRARKEERVAGWTSTRSLSGKPGSYPGGPSDSKTSSTTMLENNQPGGVPTIPPMPYIDPSIPFNPNDPSNPYAATNLYQSLDPQQIAFLQSQYAQWAMHQYPHTHPRYTINTLSTITEANSPYSVNASLSLSGGGSQYHTPASWGGSLSLGPHSPASIAAEFGHMGHGAGGTGGTGRTVDTRETGNPPPSSGLSR
ncbi:hypothetical protein ONZ45_g6986 [Pleurotus djamor]|nr:hypothetical protein ONZ45_g6986 [Pleurotus djamor]